MRINVNVNGTMLEAEVEPRLLLVHFIRETLGLTGTHWGCDTSNCGACTVLLDGEPVKSCTVLAVRADSHEVTTIEGLPDQVEPAQRGDNGLHPMQEAWLARDVAQCGYCQPGQIMAAVALVNKVAASGGRITDADLDTIRNICRCGTYTRIPEAIRDGASRM